MTLEIGQVLKDRYRIERILGEGGMGTVYMAQDQLLDRPRAIKELYPDPLADEAKLHQARLQFENEAKALKGLRHPSLPHVSDYFSIDEYDYVVMDYVEGRSLADILQGKQRPTEPLAYEWLKQVVDVLNYCHEHHIIHRDIKPANLIHTPDKRIVLVDFGLVKMLDPHNPETGNIVRGVGTPQYTPLEQYDTHRGHTDVRSDIYALGATFYHLLTGYAPQPVSQRILNPDTQPPIQEINSKISPWMAEFVQKAMAIRPEDRFQDTKEMRHELETRVFKHRAQTKAASQVVPAAHTTLIGRSAPTRQEIAESAPHRGTETTRVGKTAHRSTVAGRIPRSRPQSSADQNRPTSKQAPHPMRSHPQKDTDKPNQVPEALPMLVPMAVVFTAAVVVSVVFATGSSLATVAVIAPLLITAWAYHKLRSGRNKRPPRF
jgi:serine/threonine-protein kinase